MFTNQKYDMNALKKIIFVFITISLASFTLHKYYLSYTKINYAKDSKSLQVTMKIFTDDLENVLNQQFKINAQLNSDREINNINKHLSEYINDKFEIEVNKAKKDYTFLGKEYKNDETNIYLEIENIDKIETITITNKMLMEIFNDQQNIIKVKIDNFKKSSIYTKNNYKSSFSVN